VISFNGRNDTGHWVILSGTNDLANLRGQGTFQSTEPGAGTYSGQTHWEP